MNNIQIKANKLAADIINKALREGSIIGDSESENSLIEKELMQIEDNLRNNKLYEDVEELKRKQNEFDSFIIEKAMEEKMNRRFSHVHFLNYPQAKWLKRNE